MVENPLDADAFAQAIEKLSDKATRETMKSECIAITKMFSTEHSVAQRKCIYDLILNK